MRRRSQWTPTRCCCAARTGAGSPRRHASPETALVTQGAPGHLRGALDELPEVHTRVLVMRDLRGCPTARSPSASTSAGRRWRPRSFARAAGSSASTTSSQRGGAASRCGPYDASGRGHPVRGGRGPAGATRPALQLLPAPGARARGRAPAAPAPRRTAAAVLPLPGLLRRSGGDGSGITGFFGSGASVAPLAERAAALVAVAALAGAGGAALGTGALRGDREAAGDGRIAAERSAGGDGRTAARRHRSRHGRGASQERAGRPGGELPVRQGAAPVRPTQALGTDSRIAARHGYGGNRARRPRRARGGARPAGRRLQSPDAPGSEPQSPQRCARASRCPSVPPVGPRAGDPHTAAPACASSCRRRAAAGRPAR